MRASSFVISEEDFCKEERLRMHTHREKETEKSLVIGRSATDKYLLKGVFVPRILGFPLLLPSFVIIAEVNTKTVLFAAFKSIGFPLSIETQEE